MPPLLLAPIIIALTTIGVYAINNSLFDVWLMLAFGVMGWGMERLGIPLAPAVLAVILGPVAESSLRRAMLIGHHQVGFLFSSTIAIVMVTLIVLTILVPLVRRLLTHYRGRPSKLAMAADPQRARRHMEPEP